MKNIILSLSIMLIIIILFFWVIQALALEEPQGTLHCTPDYCIKAGELIPEEFRE